jgi:hypothetical protein
MNKDKLKKIAREEIKKILSKDGEIISPDKKKKAEN